MPGPKPAAAASAAWRGPLLDGSPVITFVPKRACVSPEAPASSAPTHTTAVTAAAHRLLTRRATTRLPPPGSTSRLDGFVGRRGRCGQKVSRPSTPTSAGTNEMDTSPEMITATAMPGPTAWKKSRFAPIRAMVPAATVSAAAITSGTTREDELRSATLRRSPASSRARTPVSVNTE